MQVIPIPCFGGLYGITPNGQVHSEPRQLSNGHRWKGGWLKPKVGTGGYLWVSLYQRGRCKLCSIHRLVLIAFVGPCPDGMEARHKNGVRSDNKLENLCWSTHAENMGDKTKHGTSGIGERNSRHRLTETQVRWIRYLFGAGVR